MLSIVIQGSIIRAQDGYCNITVTEVNFKHDQCNVIDMFLEEADEIDADMKSKSQTEK